MGQIDSIDFILALKKVDSSLPSEENFTVLMEDLSKTFEICYQSVKAISEYGDSGELSKLILESAPWKEFEFKDSLGQPNLIHSFFDLKVALDENHEVILSLGFDLYFKHDSFSFQKISETSFDVLFSTWKDQFSLNLQEHLNETAYDFRAAHDVWNRPLGSDLPIQPVPINFEFKELEELLELNGEMTTLENEQKYPELKELLNKKVLAELRKCHPDKVLLLGLDPVATAEKTQKLNNMRKKANDYLDSIIQRNSI